MSRTKKIMALVSALFLFAGAGMTGCGKPATNTPAKATQPVSVTPTALPTQAPPEAYKKHPITAYDTAFENVSGPTMDMFYVSPIGNDSNAGTKDKPFLTITAAQAAVRKISANMTGNIYINVESGTYSMLNTVKLDGNDSGSNGHRVVLRGPRDMSAVLDGGVRVTGWAKAAEIGADVYKAKVTGVESFRQLYVNGERRTKARDAASGIWNRLRSWYNPLATISVNGGDQQPVTRNDIPASWGVKYGVIVKTEDIPKTVLKNMGEVEFVLYRDWVTERAHIRDIRKINADDTVISLEYNQGKAMFTVNSPPKRTNEPFYLENAIEFLNEPGEWYFDKTSDYLYYIPREGEDIAKAEAVVPGNMETFIKIEGSFDNRAKDITVKNLRLEYSTWLQPDIYGTPSDMQATQYLTYKPENPDWLWGFRPSAMITADFVQNLVIEKNILRYVGGDGVSTIYYSDDTKISGNIIQYVAANAVYAGKYAVKSPVVNLNVSNNYINYYGQDYGGACGVLVLITKKTTIEHNEISYGPYTGISCGWGWDEAKTIAESNMIRYNNIHHVMQLLYDGGAIYTLGNQPNSEIAFNWIHDMTRGDYVPPTVGFPGMPSGAVGFHWGIYLDAKTSGVTAHDNFMSQMQNMSNAMVNVNPYNAATGMGNKGDYRTCLTDDTAVRDAAGIQSEYKSILDYK